MIIPFHKRQVTFFFWGAKAIGEKGLVGCIMLHGMGSLQFAFYLKL